MSTQAGFLYHLPPDNETGQEGKFVFEMCPDVKGAILMLIARSGVRSTGECRCSGKLQLSTRMFHFKVKCCLKYAQIWNHNYACC